MLYPQNGDRIVAVDSVTSLHPVYIYIRYTPFRVGYSLPLRTNVTLFIQEAQLSPRNRAMRRVS